MEQHDTAGLPAQAGAPIAAAWNSQALLEHAPFGFVRSKFDGTLVYANLAFARLFGYGSAAELAGKHMVEFYKIPAQRTTMIERLRGGGSVQSLEVSGITRTGSELLVELSCTLEGDNINAIVIDITARRQAERAVELAEARFATVFRAAPAVMAIIRRSDSRFIEVNETYQRLFGYRRDELVGRTTFDLNIFPNPEHRALLTQQLREQAYIRDAAIDVRAKSGQLHTLLISSESVVLGGEPCLLAIGIDITDRQQAATALQRSAARLRVLASASHAFAAAGTDHRVVFEQIARIIAEPLSAVCMIRMLSDDEQWLESVTIYYPDPAQLARMAPVFLRQPVSVNGQNLSARTLRSGKPMLETQLDPQTIRSSFPPALAEAVDEFLPHSAIFIPLHAQDRPIGVLGLIRYDPGQPPLDEDDLALAQDLAERAALAIENVRLFSQLEAERAQLARRVAERTADLSAANAELAHAARQKDEFLTNMSHELRTPLNAVLGFAEALTEDVYGSLSERQGRAINHIAESGRHLLALINDILDLSKIEAGKFEIQLEPTQIDSVCSASMRMVAQVALAKRIALTSTLDSSVVAICADERRLKQLLVNLLSNAVKFTPAGGQVGLEVQGNQQQQTVVFTVWDTGIGIAADDLPRLFQPFVQIDSSLSRQYEGSGLGLALVQRLAEAHGGSVTVSSAPGQGSRFSVTLPWVLGQPAAAPEPAGAQASPTPLAPNAQQRATPARQLHVLLAEDNRATIDVLLDFLHSQGCDVAIAHDGHEALARAQECRPDLVLMDIQMPGMDGLETIRHLRADSSTASVPIIALTALAMPGDRERCLDAGADGYLAKPVSLRSLQTMMATQIAHAGAGRLPRTR